MFTGKKIFTDAFCSEKLKGNVTFCFKEQLCQKRFSKVSLREKYPNTDLFLVHILLYSD